MLLQLHFNLTPHLHTGERSNRNRQMIALSRHCNNLQIDRIHQKQKMLLVHLKTKRSTFGFGTSLSRMKMNLLIFRKKNKITARNGTIIGISSLVNIKTMKKLTIVKKLISIIHSFTIGSFICNFTLLTLIMRSKK